jgi:hypothetical protein
MAADNKLSWRTWRTGTVEFIPFSFWYDAPLIARDSDRRHDPWLVYGWSCPSSLRLNTRGLPGERHHGKTALPIGPLWPLSGPFTPGDALETSRVDARRLLRLPPPVASHHHG